MLKINGKPAGIFCAHHRRFIGTTKLLVGTHGDEFYIAQGVYDNPVFGRVYGLRWRSLLCGRCFAWIGDQWWCEGNAFCFLVRRLSCKGLFVLRVCIEGKPALIPMQQYLKSQTTIETDVLRIIREAQHQPHTSCR